MEANKKSSSKIIIAILVILVLLLGGYIGYDKFINKETPNTTKKETKTKAESKADGTEVSDTTDLINNGERIGTYSIYMGSNDNGEYTLTFFTPNGTENTKKGFFTIVQATSMSYNNITGGFFEIKDSYIEFYSNMHSDNDKANFARAFSMEPSDLYQDSKAVSEGYTFQYRLKLNYESDKISNSNITFKKLY